MKTHIIKLSKDLVPFITEAAQQVIGGSLGWSGTSTDDGEGEFIIHFEGEVDQTLINNL